MKWLKPERWRFNHPAVMRDCVTDSSNAIAANFGRDVRGARV